MGAGTAVRDGTAPGSGVTIAGAGLAIRGWVVCQGHGILYGCTSPATSMPTMQLAALLLGLPPGRMCRLSPRLTLFAEVLTAGLLCGVGFS